MCRPWCRLTSEWAKQLFEINFYSDFKWWICVFHFTLCRHEKSFLLSLKSNIKKSEEEMQNKNEEKKQKFAKGIPRTLLIWKALETLFVGFNPMPQYSIFNKTVMSSNSTRMNVLCSEQKKRKKMTRMWKMFNIHWMICVYIIPLNVMPSKSLWINSSNLTHNPFVTLAPFLLANRLYNKHLTYIRSLFICHLCKVPVKKKQHKDHFSLSSSLFLFKLKHDVYGL